MEYQSDFVNSTPGSMDDLITLLNAAACDNPQTVMLAGQHLVQLTSCNSATRTAYANLASVVFSLSETPLTTGGRAVGMLHLKNVLFESHVWFSVDEHERSTVRSLLFNFLAAGLQPPRYINSVESVPLIGSCISELIGRLVKMEWMKVSWSDSFWNQLIAWSAWRSLRFALRSAASYRLQTRRRTFFTTVISLLPQLVYDILPLTTDDFEATIKITHLLYTCLSLTLVNNRNGPYIFTVPEAKVSTSVLADDQFGLQSPVLQTILERAFFLLSNRILIASRPLGFRLLHRSAKLIVATILATSPHLRSTCVDVVLSHCLSFLIPDKRMPPNTDQLARDTAKWLIALIYALLPVFGRSPCGLQIQLTDEGIEKVRSWLASPPSLDDHISSLYQNNMALLVYVVTDPHWFDISPAEYTALSTNPEACMSSGGLSVTDTTEQLDAGSPNLLTSALSIWDVDVACRTVISQSDSLQSLMGMSGVTENSPISSDPCRQLSELIIFRLTRYYLNESGLLLRQFVSNRITGSPCDLIGLESAMRIAQLCLVNLGCDSLEDSQWLDLINHLLSAGMSVLTSQAGTSGSCPEALTLLTTRVLCLLTRHAVYCVPTNVDVEACMVSQCSGALGHLADCLVTGTFPSADGSSSSIFGWVGPSQLCLRLAAVHSLAWLLQHASFPPESLDQQLVTRLFSGLVKLIQDVAECETRIYLLGVLCTLIESADLIGDPQLAHSMLGLLDELWRLEQHSGALRAAILDSVCLLVTVLNASPDETDSNLLHFRASLHHPAVGLVLTSVGSVDRTTESLFEPGLRLWSALLNGEGARWSPELDNLLPLLTGTSPSATSVRSSSVAAQSSGDGSLDNSRTLPGGTRHGQPPPLVQRLETREQAELFFQISDATLRLACSHGDQTVTRQFLEHWTEPFWNGIFTASAGHPTVNGVMVNQDSLRSSGGQLVPPPLLDYLFSQAAAAVSGDDDSQADDESACRLHQLRLLGTWLSVYLDSYYNSSHQQQQISSIPLPAGIVGLVVQAAHGSLVRAPANEHDDVHPRATRLRLAILSRLAVCPQPWCLLLHLLEIMLQVTGSSDLEITANQLVETCLIRWLARADAMHDSIDRRCFSVSCWMALRHCYTVSDRTAIPSSLLNPPDGQLIRHEDHLENLVAADAVHARWLEPVVSLCIQVCCEEDREIFSQADRFYAAYPVELSNRTNLLTRMGNEFSAWRDCVGGPVMADALFRCHVEPVLRNQLERHLDLTVIPPG